MSGVWACASRGFFRHITCKVADCDACVIKLSHDCEIVVGNSVGISHGLREAFNGSTDTHTSPKTPEMHDIK